MPTIKSGGDFTTMADFFFDLTGDTLAADVEGLVTGLITDSANVALSSVTFAGHTITIKPDTGQAFTENVNKLTNALRWNSSNGAALDSTANSNGWDIDSAITIQDLQWRRSVAFNVAFDAPGANITATRCIFEINEGCYGGFWWHTPTINNCLFIHTNGSISGGAFLSSQSGGTINNSVVANLATVVSTIDCSYGTTTLRNVAVYSNGSTEVAGSTTGSNNATDLAAGSGLPATGLQTSLVGTTEWENVSVGTHDFRLKSTSAKLKDNGTATSTPTTDIVNQSRSGSTDIGVWEYQAGGGGGASDSFFGRGVRGVMGGIERGLARVAEQVRSPILVVPRNFFPAR